MEYHINQPFMLVTFLSIKVFIDFVDDPLDNIACHLWCDTLEEIADVEQYFF